MRVLFFIVAMFFVGTINSQVIKIKVSEVKDTYGYDTSVTNFLKDTNLIYETRGVNSLYNIDTLDNT